MEEFECSIAEEYIYVYFELKFLVTNKNKI